MTGPFAPVVSFLTLIFISLFSTFFAFSPVIVGAYSPDGGGLAGLTFILFNFILTFIFWPINYYSFLYITRKFSLYVLPRLVIITTTLVIVSFSSPLLWVPISDRIIKPIEKKKLTQFSTEINIENERLVKSGENYNYTLDLIFNNKTAETYNNVKLFVRPKTKDGFSLTESGGDTKYINLPPGRTKISVSVGILARNGLTYLPSSERPIVHVILIGYIKSFLNNSIGEKNYKIPSKISWPAVTSL